MKFEPLFRRSTLLSSILALFIAFQSITSQKDIPKTCYRDLVASYSMEGTDYPITTNIMMCPSIKKSCCLPKDQETMYINWVTGGEEQRVMSRYEGNIRVYEQLLTNLIELQKFAKTARMNIVKTVANCKLLADRVLNFELDKIKEQVVQNLMQMKSFFIETYKGFYCSICNYENHRFFDPVKKTINFSEKFCRDIIKQNLGSLLLFHVDIVKMLNLSTKFATSCDFRGEYNLEATYPKEFIFVQPKDIVQSLRGCREHRNKKDWFSYCSDICQKFTIAEFSEYFEPNIEQISRFNDFIQDKLRQLNDQKTRSAVMGATSNRDRGGNRRRLLSDSGEDQSNTKSLTIYGPGLKQSWDLKSAVYKHVFTTDGGISSYDEGRNSLITENIRNVVKTELDIERDGSIISKSIDLSSDDNKVLNLAKSARVLKLGENGQEGSGKRGRKLKNAALAKVFGVLVGLFALLWI